MKKSKRDIAEKNLNISERVQVNVIRAVKNAEHIIKDDYDALELMKRIDNKKLHINEIENDKKFDKLIEYGMVNRLVNNEVVMSGIGHQVLNELTKHKSTPKQV